MSKQIHAAPSLASSNRLRGYAYKFLAGVIFLAAFAFYFSNISLYSPLTISRGGNAIVGDSPSIASSMRRVTFRGDMRKHLLFSATTAPVVIALHDFLSVDEVTARILVLALISAADVAGVFLLMRKLFSSATSALVFALLFAAFFYNLVLFSIPETYALTDLLILVYLLALLGLRERLDWRSGIPLTLLAALASLYNPPLLSLVLIHIVLLHRRSEMRPWLRFALANLALAMALYLSVNLLIQGPSFVKFVWKYGGKYTSLMNLLSLQNIGVVLVNFFLYSILSPVGYLPHYWTLEEASGYLASAPRLALLAVVVAAVICGVFVAISRRSEYRRLARALLVWIGVLVMFYFLWEPTHATVWSMQGLLPLLTILAIGFKNVASADTIKRSVVILLGVLIAVNNCLAFYAGPPSP